jgi:hypothetical protein
MLEDDGHFFGILATQAVRHADTVGLGVERNVEMMVAREAFLGCIG